MFIKLLIFVYSSQSYEYQKFILSYLSTITLVFLISPSQSMTLIDMKMRREGDFAESFLRRPERYAGGEFNAVRSKDG